MKLTIIVMVVWDQDLLVCLVLLYSQKKNFIFIKFIIINSSHKKSFYSQEFLKQILQLLHYYKNSKQSL